MADEEKEQTKRRVINQMRTYLAAQGGDKHLYMTDDEIWRWVESMVEDMNAHAANRAVLQADESPRRSGTP